MMDGNFSKPIQKTDDSAKQLIIDALEGQVTGGFDLDSVYHIKDSYIVMEFLKCDTVRPKYSHPNRYWFKNKQKFISLWDITQRLGGKLFLINYEDSREQFKVILVEAIDPENGITKEKSQEMDFNKFKEWFKFINKTALDKY